MRISHVVCFAAAMAALTTPAHAYLDPGTGSMVLQAMLAAIAVGAASVSMFWQRLKSFFSPRQRSARKPDDEKKTNRP